jgi:dTDP-4-amino-4,6-dideoxygalactose transaminase
MCPTTVTAAAITKKLSSACVALKFPATASAVYRCGHVPVVFDIDINS